MRATSILRFICIFLLLIGVILANSLTGNAQTTLGYKIVYKDSVTATAYNSMVGQTDNSPWITASGTKCREGVIASNHLPIGTKVIIEGFGNRVFTVEDRMNKRYKKRIDIWFRNHKDAMNFGVRKVNYYVVASVK